LSREEIEHPVASLEPDLARLAGTPLEGLARAGDLDGLKPIIRSTVSRTSWIVEVGGSRIQVDFDEGEMSAGGNSQRFDELELELLSGEPACLLTAAKMIADRVPVRIGVLTKAERGARITTGAFERITKAAPVAVVHGMTVAQAFEVMLHACLKHYRLNEPLVLNQRKKEALHQCRVAMRRLRAAFALFKSAIADVEYQYLREELRWFTGQLGDARNLDVYLERDLAGSEREAVTARREQAYEQVIATMNSQRFRLLAIELVGWTAFGPWRSGKAARKPVEGYAASRLDRLWRGIADAGHHIAGLDEHDRHRLRIQVKKMRYAIEFLRGLYPDHASTEKRFARAVADLQESLGKLNDLATARSLAIAGPSTDWLIGEPSERLHLRESEQAFRDLAGVGPFWRDARGQ
jgi:inorganic triphosphatase YgiF